MVHKYRYRAITSCYSYPRTKYFISLLSLRNQYIYVQFLIGTHTDDDDDDDADDIRRCVLHDLSFSCRVSYSDNEDNQ